MNIKSLLLKQAVIIPFIWIIPVAIGLFTEEYRSMEMHISQLTNFHADGFMSFLLLGSLFSVGIASLAFFIGLIVYHSRVSISAMLGVLYSLGMISNAVFPTGSPLHGLWGLPIFSIIVPCIFALEYFNTENHSLFVNYSILTTVFNLGYFWLIISGIDGPEIRGLTQRLAIFVFNSWIAIAALQLHRNWKTLSRTTDPI